MILRGLLFLTMILCGLHVNGQVKNTQIKVYNKLNIISTKHLPNFLDCCADNWIEYSGISLAVQFLSNNEKNYHEIEWSNLKSKSFSDNFYDKSELALGARYEYGRILNKNIDNRLIYKIGGAARLLYYNFKVDPTNSSVTNLYPVDEKRYSLEFGLVPHLEFYITPKIFISTNIIFSLIELKEHTKFVDNPNYTDRQKNQVLARTSLFDEVLLRIGGGFRF